MGKGQRGELLTAWPGAGYRADGKTQLTQDGPVSIRSEMGGGSLGIYFTILSILYIFGKFHN